MAFQTVTGSDQKSLGNLQAGESLTAFLKDVVVEPNAFGGTSFNFLMVDPDTTKEFKVLTNGTAKYVGKNIAEKKGLVQPDKNSRPDSIERDVKMVGKLVRITKVGTYINAQKKEVSKYQFECDPEKSLF